MIFNIHHIKDNFLENIYTDSIKDLNEFYEINWTHHLPTIIIVDDRETINLLKGSKTENWVAGWTNGSQIYVLNKNNFEKESSHKCNPDEYSALIKHELSHCFYNILSNYHHIPIWLSEGVASYTSGQNNFKNKPKEFNKFLACYDHGGKGVYGESGFFVQILVEKFGKQKLLNLIKELKSLKSQEEFDKFFAKEYGFNLNYDEINAQKLLA
ncbi:MAG: hypothetical protein Q7R89_01135 [bacterium]|nr:hypothetical protein [bacterium]